MPPRAFRYFFKAACAYIVQVGNVIPQPRFDEVLAWCEEKGRAHGADVKKDGVSYEDAKEIPDVFEQYSDWDLFLSEIRERLGFTDPAGTGTFRGIPEGEEEQEYYDALMDAIDAYWGGFFSVWEDE